MIKLVFCLRRLPHLSREEFQRRWRGEHGLLVQQHAGALKLRRYVQSHTLADPRVAAVAQVRGSEGREFDGVAELWWENVESVLEVLTTEAGQAAAAALLQDEAQFIDLPNSPIFFSQEVVLVG